MPFKSTPAAGAVIKVKINGNFTAIGGVEGIPEFGPDRAWIDATAINDTGKKYTADMPDYGEQALTGDSDTKDAGQVELLAGAIDATATARDFEITFTSGAKSTFSAIVGSFRHSANKGQNEKFSSKLKLSGVVSYTPAS